MLEREMLQMEKSDQYGGKYDIMLKNSEMFPPFLFKDVFGDLKLWLRPNVSARNNFCLRCSERIQRAEARQRRRNQQSLVRKDKLLWSLKVPLEKGHIALIAQHSQELPPRFVCFFAKKNDTSN